MARLVGVEGDQCALADAGDFGQRHVNHATDPQTVGAFTTSRDCRPRRIVARVNTAESRNAMPYRAASLVVAASDGPAG